MDATFAADPEMERGGLAPTRGPEMERGGLAPTRGTEAA
jgi:hypothetical protein